MKGRNFNSPWLLLLRWAAFSVATLATFAAPPAGGQSGQGGCTAEGCHADLLKTAFVHPAAKDGCETCHESSGAPHPGTKGAEFTLVAEGADLCLSCHEVVTEKGSVHPPARDGECLTCHDPHGSNISRLLVEPLPELCTMCHDGYQQPEGDSGSVHGVIKGKRSCLSCHWPHDSSLKNLLIREQPDLCLECHSAPLEKDGRTIEAVGKRVQNDKFVHPALEMSGCSTCHVPHVSEYPHLLSASFPQGFYGKGSVQTYELCFGCHDTALAEAKNDVGATEFRSGGRNLHYVHVMREKSRSCVACHDMHASNLPHLLRKFVWFGRWKMPLEPVQTENGGSCRPGCHGQAEYKR